MTSSCAISSDHYRYAPKFIMFPFMSCNPIIV